MNNCMSSPHVCVLHYHLKKAKNKNKSRTQITVAQYLSKGKGNKKMD